METRGIFSVGRDISEPFLLCLNIFPHFCGVTWSMRDEEVILPIFVWNLLISGRTIVVWKSVIQQLWHRWWVHSVTRDVHVLRSAILDIPKIG